MCKGTHFFEQPVYGQLIKRQDKAKIVEMSRKIGGERYVKRFDAWHHLLTMLYAVVMRFDSLREIIVSLMDEIHKLHHLGINFKIGKTTLADANRHRPEVIFERHLPPVVRHIPQLAFLGQPQRRRGGMDEKA